MIEYDWKEELTLQLNVINWILRIGNGIFWKKRILRKKCLLKKEVTVIFHRDLLDDPNL